MFDDLVYWHWWALALGLAIIEILAPGTYFLWLAGAAAITGLVVLVFPDMPIFGQWILFALLAVIAVFASRAWVRRHPIESADPDLNRRGQQYVGRLLTLDAPITNGRGRIRIGDTVWSANGIDLPAGAKVRVVGVEGTSLRSEPAADGERTG